MKYSTSVLQSVKGTHIYFIVYVLCCARSISLHDTSHTVRKEEIVECEFGQWTCISIEILGFVEIDKTVFGK